MGKQESTDDVSYDDKANKVSVISQPLAHKKLGKKILKVIKKGKIPSLMQATKAKSVKRGVKEVVKGLRKGAKGCVIIAGDIFPLDVIAHLPVLCEEANIPYIYVPSKEDLGSTGAVKNPTSCIMILDASKDAEYKSTFDEVYSEIKDLNKKVIQ